MGIDTILAQQDVAPFLIGAIIGALFAAFFAFRFFKLSLIVSGAFLGYSIGSVTLDMLLSDRITEFNASLVLGLICAVLFAIIVPKFYKLCIYLIGGYLGFFLGIAIVAPVLTAFGYEDIGAIVGVVAGIVLIFPAAKIFVRLFKPYLILSTSFGGSMIAAICTSLLIFGDNAVAILAFALVGLVLTVISAAAQFKMNEDRAFDL